MSDSSFTIIAGTIAAISCIALLILLSLIRKARMNGFIIIIRALAISTLIYELCFFFGFTFGSGGGHGAYIFVNVFGDSLQAIWTVILLLTLFRTVFFLQTVNILREYPYYCAIDFAFGCFFLIFLGVTAGPNPTKSCLGYRVFYWFRASALFINLFLYFACALLVFSLPHQVRLGKLTEFQANGVRTLVFRMRYYGLVQIIMRIGTLWYNYNANTLNNPVAHYFDVLTAPSCGLGYLFVYLYMQPEAVHHFYQIYLPGIKYESRTSKVPVNLDHRPTDSARITISEYCEEIYNPSFATSNSPEQSVSMSRPTSIYQKSELLMISISETTVRDSESMT
jgi:hypothetical protein